MDAESDATAAQCISRLEQLNQEIIAAVVESRVDSIEDLVVEQCVWARRLEGKPLDLAERERLGRLADSVRTQQTLVAQALHMVEGVMQTLGSHRAFSRVG